MASCAMSKEGCGHISPSCNVPNVFFVGSPVCMSAHTEISSYSAGDNASLRGILRGTSVGVLLTSAIVLLPVALRSVEGTERVKHMSNIGRNRVPGTYPSIPVGGEGVGLESSSCQIADPLRACVQDAMHANGK